MSGYQSPIQRAMELRQMGWRYFPKTKQYQAFWLHETGVRARAAWEAYKLNPKWKPIDREAGDEE